MRTGTIHASTDGTAVPLRVRPFSQASQFFSRLTRLLPAALLLVLICPPACRALDTSVCTAAGRADDTAAIQAAIDQAAAGGGGTVTFAPGVYAVSRAGSRTVRLFSAGGCGQTYAVLLRSGVTLNLNGSTVRLADGQNCSMFLNRNSDSLLPPYDHDIAILNGVLDGNRTGQTTQPQYMAGIQIQHAQNVSLQNLRWDNIRDTALLLFDVDTVTADNLDVTWSDGDGFSLGSYNAALLALGFDNSCRNATFGTLTVDNVHNNVYSPNGIVFRQGNPIIGDLHNATFGALISHNCGGGWKVLDGSNGVAVNQASFYGAAGADQTPTNNTLNSGFKVQTSFAPAANVTVNSLYVQNALGGGIYFEGAFDCTVHSYQGVGNCATGVRPDVWLGTGARHTIDSLTSTGAGGTGVLVRAANSQITLGQVTITNCSQATARQYNALEGDGAGGQIGTLTVRDTTSHIHCGLYIPSMDALLLMPPAYTIGARDILCASPMSLNSAASSITTIAN